MNRSSRCASLAGSLLLFLVSVETEARAQDAERGESSERGESTETSDDRAPAPEPARFGAARTLVVSSDSQLSLSYTSNFDGTTAKDGASTTTFILAPAVDYFVAKGFSVGGTASLLWEEQDPGGGGATTNLAGFGVGPRVGVSYVVVNASADVPTPNAVGSTVHETATLSVFQVTASAPVVFEVAPHFFFGFGPALFADVSSTQTFSSSSQSVDQPKELRIGAQVTLGGWL
jgi:hypothetical protein